MIISITFYCRFYYYLSFVSLFTTPIPQPQSSSLFLSISIFLSKTESIYCAEVALKYYKFYGSNQSSGNHSQCWQFVVIRRDSFTITIDQLSVVKRHSTTWWRKIGNKNKCWWKGNKKGNIRNNLNRFHFLLTRSFYRLIGKLNGIGSETM